MQSCKIQQEQAEEPSRAIWRSYAQYQRIQKEKDKLDEELRQLKQSRSYGIGEMVTWLPGKIKMLIRGRED